VADDSQSAAFIKVSERCLCVLRRRQRRQKGWGIASPSGTNLTNSGTKRTSAGEIPDSLKGGHPSIRSARYGVPASACQEEIGTVWMRDAN